MHYAIKNDHKYTIQIIYIFLIFIEKVQIIDDINLSIFFKPYISKICNSFLFNIYIYMINWT